MGLTFEPIPGATKELQHFETRQTSAQSVCMKTAQELDKVVCKCYSTNKPELPAAIKYTWFPHESFEAFVVLVQINIKICPLEWPWIFILEYWSNHCAHLSAPTGLFTHYSDFWETRQINAKVDYPMGCYGDGHKSFQFDGWLEPHPQTKSKIKLKMRHFGWTRDWEASQEHASGKRLSSTHCSATSWSRKLSYKVWALFYWKWACICSWIRVLAAVELWNITGFDKHRCPENHLYEISIINKLKDVTATAWAKICPKHSTLKQSS